LGSPPHRPAETGGVYAAVARRARDAAMEARAGSDAVLRVGRASAASRLRPKRRAPGPRLSPREEEPRGFRVQGHRILPVPTFRAEPSVGLTFGLRGRYVYRPPGETFDHARLDLVGRVSTKRVQDHTLDLQLRDLLHRQEILD